MKILIETIRKEIIATVYTQQKKDKDGNPIWADEKNCIAQCINAVDSFKWYEPLKDGSICVSISAYEIKQLAAFIDEQSLIETNEFRVKNNL